VEAQIVEGLVVGITDEGIADLRRILDEVAHASDFRSCTRTVHTEIARLSGNPIAELVLRMFNDLFHANAEHLDSDQSRICYEPHVELIDAIEARDGQAAVAAVRRVFELTRAVAFSPV
jgi:DNA-binding FadR family transcriptional regulator